MRQTKPYQHRLRFQQFDRFTLAAFFLLFSATATVAEAPIRVDNFLISDTEIPTQGWTAREHSEIQQRLATLGKVPALCDSSSMTDSEKPTPRSMAQEILEIQQRLGGSIVSDREALRDITPISAADHAEVTDFPEAVVQYNSDFLAGQSAANTFSPQEETVESLRDAAWQLDQSAEKLERSDLYKQADALRDLAQQFRLDARAFRSKFNE